jgi:hypothetical protein
MDTSDFDLDITLRLAKWATGWLASSMVLVIGVFVLLLVVADFRTWMVERPVGSLLALSLVAGYIVSFACLHQIRRRGKNESKRLWFLSLGGAITPLVVLACSFGASGAVLAIGIAEVVAILLHIVAIASIFRRVAPPNTSFERTREG